MLGHLVSNVPAEQGQPLRLATWLKRLLTRLGLR
jgi:hypothetical protein